MLNQDWTEGDQVFLSSILYDKILSLTGRVWTGISQFSVLHHLFWYIAWAQLKIIYAFVHNFTEKTSSLKHYFKTMNSFLYYSIVFSIYLTDLKINANQFHILRKKYKSQHVIYNLRNLAFKILTNRIQFHCCCQD